MEGMAPVVPEKVAVVALGGTMTEAGRLRMPAMDPEMATEAPPDPAGPLSVTVQMAAALEAKDVGLHASELTVDKVERPRLTVPPVAVVTTGLPPGSEARPLKPTAMMPEPETVAATVATLPLPMAVASGPLATQVYPPNVVVQLRLLPAAVNAGPAATETLDTLPG